MSQIWTIGHSTHTIEEFVAMLEAHGIQVLADVRRFPASRRYPHFNAVPLREVLQAHNIVYEHFEVLGGRRAPRKDSHNTAWRNDSFRGYADYMETREFKDGIAHLKNTATEQPTAIMCAEAVWWRCHRGLISDCLKVYGWRVLHIMDVKKAEEHPYTSAARIVDGELTYSPDEEQLAIKFGDGNS